MEWQQEWRKTYQGAPQNPLLITVPSYISVTSWMKEDKKYFIFWNTLLNTEKMHVSIQLKFLQTEHTSVTNSQVFKKWIIISLEASSCPLFQSLPIHPRKTTILISQLYRSVLLFRHLLYMEYRVYPFLYPALVFNICPTQISEGNK